MATSKLYYLPETKTQFLASGGDVTHTLTSLAAGAGRQSAQLDRGAETTGHPFLFRWRFWCQFATAPVVDESIDIYIKTSDGTHLDNDDGTGDIALSAENKLKNLHYIGSMIVDEASATPEFSASGTFECYERYLNVVVWNDTADALSATAAEHGFYIEEVPHQGQAT